MLSISLLSGICDARVLGCITTTPQYAAGTKPNNTTIHTITPKYVVASDIISGMSTDGFSADLLRDPDSRLIIGFTRGGVEQHWERGTAGRITGAHTYSTVTGAPSFNYTTFDPKGRRKTVQTNRGSWFYDYKGGNNGDGQLASASNGTLNADYNYNFDDIGRRAFGANQQNPLNQFVSITHPQTPKNLYIKAHPDARLWVNGVEAQQFEGAWVHLLDHPGLSGGWIPWQVKGVLEDAGEGAGDPPANPNANADAVAEYSGFTWFPPATETFTFDADGNRESSALWNYGWDGRNRLVRARTKTWDTAPQGWDVKFDYDAEGRRFKKEITRYEAGEKTEEKVVFFVWDGWDLLYERHQDIHGNLLFDRKYIWGPDIADGAAGGAGGLLLIRETRGQTTKDYYPIYDGTGHVTGLTDSTGNLVAEYWYGPFGELIESKGELAEINPIRYATKYYDAETGLYYFGFRYYDPVTGHWMNREPLGEDESLNLYAYCHNDPVNKIDVFGLASIALIDGNILKTGELDHEVLARISESRRLVQQRADDESRINLYTRLSLIDAPIQAAMQTVWENPSNYDKARSTITNWLEAADVYPHFELYDHYMSALRDVSTSALLDGRVDKDSFEYKIAELLMGVVEFPGHAVAFTISLAAATDVTTGNAVVYNGYGNGFGLAEVSSGERWLAAGLVIAPYARYGRGAATGMGDDLISFYHATSKAGAKSISANGINVRAGRVKLDFGQGFYTTVDPLQASRWAANKFGADGVVLEFKVSRSALEGMSNLNMADASYFSLCRFYRHNRLGGRLHAYDIVNGPMLGNPGDFLHGIPGRTHGQQTSWHSQIAAEILWNGLVR